MDEKPDTKIETEDKPEQIKDTVTTPPVVSTKKKISPGKGIFLVLLVALAIVVAMATNLSVVQDWLLNPTDVFFSDETLKDAADNLIASNRIIRSNPGNEQAHLDRATAFLTLGHIEGAVLEWHEWKDKGGSEWGNVGRQIQELQLKTDEIRALLIEAENSQSPSDKYPPIYTLLDDISERYSGIPMYRALFLKGYLLLREGRRAEAEPIFRDQLEGYATLGPYVLYNHARSLNVSGTGDESLSRFEEFLKTYPSNRLAPIVILERINILRDLGRIDDAMKECQRALDSYPSSLFSAKALRKLAEIYETELDFENGALTRVRLVREFPDSIEIRATVDMFFGGLYDLRLLNEQDRLAIAFASVDAHPNDSFDVLSVLAESDSLTPDERAMACHGSARCEFNRGQYYECIDWANRAKDTAPSSEWASRAGVRIGYAYQRLDKHIRAREAFSDVATGGGLAAPIAAELLYESAYLIRDLDKISAACRLIVEEYPTSDECPAAMVMLAYLGVRKGQYQSAKGYSENFISSFPDSKYLSEAMFWHARALEGLNRTGDANKAYRELAALCPWNFYGIRASEKIGEKFDYSGQVDPFDFNVENLSCFKNELALAWELYYAGVPELADSEFKLAMENGRIGARMGIALIDAESGDLHSALVNARIGSATGDQAGLTPSLANELIENIYPTPYENFVRNAALAHDVPASWLWGVMRQESLFYKRAHSSSGARGLIQIMPSTGTFIADQRGASSFDPDSLWDPELNLDYGAWYLAYLRRRIGGNYVTEVLTAYNGGPGALERWKRVLPTRDIDIFIRAVPNEESRNFARWVYCNIRMYERILENR